MAKQLAVRDDLEDIQAIYSSDLKRSYQIIDPLVKKLNRKIIKDINLLKGRWVNHDEQPNVSILDAPFVYESRQDLSIRAMGSLNSTATSSIRFSIAIVTHGTFMECFLRSYHRKLVLMNIK